MERCPNCGTPGRPGAKFCTTCGTKMGGNDEDTDPTASPDPTATAAEQTPNGTPGATSAEGWPPAPALPVPPPDRPAEPTSIAETPMTDNREQIVEVVASAWSGLAETSWPAAPASDQAAQAAAASPLAEAVIPAETDADADLAQEDDAPGSEAHDRVMRLLDELRAAISLVGEGKHHDLGGVIAELEVAVTPPGAIASDNLAELRSTLLAARERPRDVDTIVDLSHRVDAIVALIFAYDRTIAAIERALVILRGQESDR